MWCHVVQSGFHQFDLAVPSSQVPIAGYATVLGVFVGNTAYEANCFVGAMAALYVLYTNVVWFRVLMAMITGVATLAALLWGDVDQIGAALGVIVLAMMVIFAVTAGYVNVPAREFGLGLIPNFPSGSSITVLSLVATTCLPFNVFLAASLCGDASGGEMRRGIGFASTITAIISVLLVLIGSDITIPLDADFAVEDLGNQIGDNLGFEAKVLFCIGLYAAAYSSAITCPLGAALTAEQILYDDRTSLSSGTTASRVTEYSVLDAKPAAAGVLTAPLSWSWLQKWQRGGLFFRGSLFISVGVSIVISSANMDTVSVILFAQVVNGLLLPFVATSLFLCLNDPAIMPRPVLVRDNVLMLVCVGITIFLASYLVLDQISLLVAGRLETEDINEDGEGAWSTELNIYVALAVGFIGAVILALRRYGWRRQTVDG
jgi:manganese transport protein